MATYAEKGAAKVQAEVFNNQKRVKPKLMQNKNLELPILQLELPFCNMECLW